MNVKRYALLIGIWIAGVTHELRVTDARQLKCGVRGPRHIAAQARAASACLPKQGAMHRLMHASCRRRRRLGTTAALLQRGRQHLFRPVPQGGSQLGVPRRLAGLGYRAVGQVGAALPLQLACGGGNKCIALVGCKISEAGALPVSGSQQGSACAASNARAGRLPEHYWLPLPPPDRPAVAANTLVAAPWLTVFMKGAPKKFITAAGQPMCRCSGVLITPAGAAGAATGGLSTLVGGSRPRL